MARKLTVGLAILVAILAIGVGVAISDRDKSTKAAADLAGAWTFDASKSDAPPAMGGRGGWMRRGGMRTEGGPGAGRRGRMARLPEQFRIQQTPDRVSLVDSVGAPIEEIQLGGKAAVPSGDEPNAVPVFSGEWKKGRLEIVRKGPRGGQLTQSFALEEGGRELVVRTKMESGDSRPSREFKRVYRRSNT